jgi:ABC-type polysaccharide/polyol phosphate transport system ATPase subunit
MPAALPDRPTTMADLEFTNVSKRYRVREDATAPSGPGVIARIQDLRPQYKDFWAVRDVSFSVPHGEALGIIGHNGAGKSTILKLISSITTPTMGEIRIKGRLSALIEVGSGFHPELTGRENVYLSGSILGMRRREITQNLENIVEFAGVREFIDTPVKRYSSGMYVRLGFAIAAYLNPDVLLLDEVLAVGDASFQAKCLTRITELKRAGTTIVFISHDLGAVERLCDRVILMQRGTLAAEGTPREVIAEYERIATKYVASAPPLSQAEQLPRTARVTGLSFVGGDGRETGTLRTGDRFTAVVRYTAVAPIRNAEFELFFHSQDGALQCQMRTKPDLQRLDLAAGSGTVEFDCSELGLQPGRYYIDTAIVENDWQHRCATLRVDPGTVVRGNFYMPHRSRHLPDAHPGAHESQRATAGAAKAER